MKIAVIQGSSQKDKNQLLYTTVKDAVEKNGDEVVNFGVFPDEDITFSYIQSSLCISLLLESQSVDFVVTGCSSGQGMMLACNSFPGVLCGYVESPADAYLFGRINDGNAISYPLGLNFAWAAEINLKSVLEALFTEPFGSGYEKKDAERKRRDTKFLKRINTLAKKSLAEILPLLEEDFLQSVLSRHCVYEYILAHGKNDVLKKELERYKKALSDK